LAPSDPAAYVLPKSLRTERKWLGPSPGMDPQSTKIKNLVKEVTQGKETAWEQLEAVYDAVRDRVKLDRANPKHVNDALKDGKANKEMLTAVFVTCCRAMKVPARTVWITDGCYAEFYLEDAKGKGFWFPAMLIGDKQFGKLENFHPILQKGDNFKVPELNEPQKFVPEVLKGKPSLAGGGRPEVEFVRRVE
jgi:transglutaminase-like putative cysteine protease